MDAQQRITSIAGFPRKSPVYSLSTSLFFSPNLQRSRYMMTEHPDMNGAESLVRTLLAGGVDICFTNPGTSEMHFVAALD